jgi:hypothetical protein
MVIDPTDLSHPDMVRLTEVLQQLTTMLATGGYQTEMRDPYKEYGTEVPGRDMKITHVDAPAYYAAVKTTAQPDGTRLVAHSATFHRPGFTRCVWSSVSDPAAAYGEIVQFIAKNYSDFRRDEFSQRSS